MNEPGPLSLASAPVVCVTFDRVEYTGSGTRDRGLFFRPPKPNLLLAENGEEVGVAQRVDIENRFAVEFLDSEHRRVCSASRRREGVFLGDVWRITGSDDEQIATIRKRHVIIRGRPIPFVINIRFFDVVSEGATVAALERAWRPHRALLRQPPDGPIVAEIRRPLWFWRVSFASDASTFAARSASPHYG